MTLLELQERLKTDFPSLPISKDCAHGKTKGLILFNEKVISIVQINKEFALASGEFRYQKLPQEDHLSLRVKFIRVSGFDTITENTVINLSICNGEDYQLLHSIITHSKALS